MERGMRAAPSSEEMTWRVWWRGVTLPSPVASLRTSPTCMRSWPSVGEEGWFTFVWSSREVRYDVVSKVSGSATMREDMVRER